MKVYEAEELQQAGFVRSGMYIPHRAMIWQDSRIERQIGESGLTLEEPFSEAGNIEELWAHLIDNKAEGAEKNDRDIA